MERPVNIARNRILAAGALFGVLLFVLIACGCRSLTPHAKVEREVHPPEDIAATYNQVRLRMRSLVGPMCGEIEETADDIMSTTTNAAVRQAALLWKIEGVPA